MRCLRCLECNKPLINKRADALFCNTKCRVAYNRKKKSCPGAKKKKKKKTILSLCDYSGNWIKPYRESGYNIIQVDLKHGQDVRLLELPETPIYGILAAPPCTCFSNASNAVKWTDQDMQQALSIVDACLRFVAVADPVFWALENPIGKLRRYLGEPAFYFDPCDYGDFGEAYPKRTCLWGKFNNPKPQNRLEPLKPEKNRHSIDVYLKKQGIPIGRYERRSTVRSLTPLGFSHAFFEVNQ